MNGAKRLINIADKYPDEPVLERAMEAAESTYSYAEAYLAYWISKGILPDVQDSAGAKLGREVVLQLSKPPVIKDRQNHKVVYTLSGHKGFKSRMKVRSNQDSPQTLCTSVDEDGSFSGGSGKLARAHRREQIAKEGRGGTGIPRTGVIMKGGKCKPFDTRVPDHCWWMR